MTARKRKHNESFKTYRSALKREAQELKQFKKGRMIYVSVYYRPKSPLGTEMVRISNGPCKRIDYA